MSLPSKKRKLSDETSLPPIDVTSPKQARKDSGADASATSDDTAAMALKALSALDAQQQTRNPLLLKSRKASLDSSMESDQALGLAPLCSSSGEQDSKNMNAANKPYKSNKSSSTALDHLDALGDDAASMGSSSNKHKAAKPVELTIGGEDAASGGSGGASSNQRVLLDALLSSNNPARRDRLESWGGMSDLSATGFGVGGDGRLGDAAAALAASALHYTGLIEDVTAAAHYPRTGSIGSLSSGEHNAASKTSGGDRKMSISDISMFGEGSDQVVPHIQAFVDAAMATVGDQLEDLAGAVEMAASGTDVGSVSSDVVVPRKDSAADSDVSSTVSPLIGGVTEFAARKRPRSLSTSSKPLSVDYDAVAAAVNAAQAATGNLDLASISRAPIPSVVVSNTSGSSDLDRKPAAVSSTGAEKDLEAVRARARQAAGYVPPTPKDGTPEPRPPLKKRPKQPSPENNNLMVPDIAESTPRVSNISRELLGNPPLPPLTVSSAPPKMPSHPQVSEKKWDDMFDCLVAFRDEKKEEAFKLLSEKEKEEWKWDGNVPTQYKTPNGKSLGRWVNNQRTAKRKGTLRQDREDKLIGTGLRWTQLATSSWNEMLNELRIYVEEKTKNGQEWDGNVPASYQVKRKDPSGEDKNLGRWVNRQRSNRQNGKLQKDREGALTALGLKWSVLSSTSWEDMYKALCDYAKEQKARDPKNMWDGNVPSTYKTRDDPPKALGRWVNRQRSNYGSKKIKKEHIEKLNALGLKWSVHERRYQSVPNAVPGTHVLVDNAKKEVPVPSKDDKEEVPPATSKDEEKEAKAPSTEAKVAASTRSTRSAAINKKETSSSSDSSSAPALRTENDRKSKRIKAMQTAAV